MKLKIQKIIADAGICSRRKAEELIKEGLVTVNGKTAKIGERADPETDYIKVRGKLINPILKKKKYIYYLLNKPVGYLCTVKDPSHRPTVMDLVKSRERIYPVGRLDMMSSGLVILTNDGELANLLTKAGKHPKKYLVKVKGNPTEKQLKRLRQGILLDGEKLAPCEINVRKIKPESYTWLEVILYQGKNRQIRRMFDAIFHPVLKLKRIAIGPISDRGLPVGHYRELTEKEVMELKNVMGNKETKGEKKSKKN